MTIEQTNFAIEISRALIWQYDSAPKIRSMIEDKQKWVDANVVQFWENWYRDVYDLRTANDFGLQVWAAILGMKFNITVDIPTDWFSFDDQSEYFDNFGFYPEDYDNLTTEQKRTILQLRYRQITTGATIPEIDATIKSILPTAMIVDNLNMTLSIASPTMPSAELLYVLDNFDVLPRPAGVKIDRRLGYEDWFGFDDTGSSFDTSYFGGE